MKTLNYLSQHKSTRAKFAQAAQNIFHPDEQSEITKKLNKTAFTSNDIVYFLKHFKYEDVA